MGDLSVNDIILTPLKRIPLVDGDVLKCIQPGDTGFIEFGEAYFSIINKGAVKAWKRHLRMTINIVVPVGRVQFVFKDESNQILEYTIGTENYVRLTVPPGLWFGFCGLHEPFSLILNIADIPHDSNEVERMLVSDLQYNWK